MTTAPYDRIIACIDDDAASDRALEEAVRLRALGPGKLDIVHVAPRPLLLVSGPYGYVASPVDLYSEAQRWLRERAAEVPSGSPVMLEGYPPRATCEYAEQVGADLIVAAAHRGIVSRAMLGGFAAYVAYHAPCAVLLVRPPEETEQESAEAG